ncbi:MAG TPA: DUF1264 domain-containing protein [Candidatus Baltobacteraceae bacterium]|nr:DUF1264 domain-containing protein [Candidatus Baltobacteraceae bacterium]
MTKFALAAVIGAAFIAGVFAALSFPAVRAADMAAASPTQGWTLHVDAEKHFGDAHPTEIAHHWCKAVSNGLTECQLYSSDAPNAQIVGLETIVSPAVYKTFPASEQALWHYHKDEIPRVHATLPGLSPEQAKKVVDSISDTYGKVYILFDPMATGDQPTGQPSVVVPK